MKRIVFAACGLIVGVSFAGVPVELKNAGFHETDGEGGAVGWSRHPNWHAEKAGHNGSGGMVWECASAAAFERGGPGQRVTLKPGKRYDFHALVKTEGVVTQRKSIYQGLTVCVECYGADGKMMFYDMARPTASGTYGLVVGALQLPEALRRQAERLAVREDLVLHEALHLWTRRGRQHVPCRTRDGGGGGRVPACVPP